MVRAVVYFDTSDPGGFVGALSANAGSVMAADGYRGHELLRGVEDPMRFLLIVDWDSIADHQAWQQQHAAGFLGALGPFMKGSPDIKHFE